jgi:hypothetical protein
MEQGAKLTAFGFGQPMVIRLFAPRFQLRAFQP